MNVTDDPEDDGQPPWDDADAEALVGSHVLIGLTHCSASGEVIDREQLHGLVQKADRREGFLISLQGAHEGESQRFPPHPAAFEVANPGVYRLRTTGEEVVDPDYLATWTVTKPD
jgi:hypothetical protein